VVLRNEEGIKIGFDTDNGGQVFLKLKASLGFLPIVVNFVFNGTQWVVRYLVEVLSHKRGNVGSHVASLMTQIVATKKRGFILFRKGTNRQ
jgi:hypothetical protein